MGVSICMYVWKCIYVCMVVYCMSVYMHVYVEIHADNPQTRDHDSRGLHARVSGLAKDVRASRYAVPSTEMPTMQLA